MATHLLHHSTYARVEVTGLEGHAIHTWALMAGRILFGGFFLYSGIDHWMNAATLATYAAARGVPLPELAVLGSGTLILIGGLSVLFGVLPRWGAGLIALFLLGVTPVMHAFWSDPDAQARAADMVNFSKNVALLGGACLVAALPEPWPASMFHRQHAHVEVTQN